MNGERGGIVTGWLLRLAILLTVFALAAFETGAIVIAKVQADGTAIDAASVAGERYHDTRSPQAARAAADAFARGEGARVIGFKVGADRRTVTVTIRRRAKTLFIHKIGFLKNHTVARASHKGLVR